MHYGIYARVPFMDKTLLLANTLHLGRDAFVVVQFMRTDSECTLNFFDDLVNLN